MPRRRRYRKRRYRRRRPGIAKLRRQVKAISSRAELKYYDLDDVDATCNIHTGAWYGANLNAGIRQPLSIGAAGTTLNTHDQRDGLMYKLKRLTIRGYFDNSAGNSPKDVMVRMIIFRAKYQNNIEQTAALLLSDVNNINSLRRMEHKTRYKVYVDQTFTMRAASEDNAQSYLPVKINIPLNSVVQCNGNLGTFADIERNGLWILLCSSTASADAPHFYFNYRITFYDS